MLDNNYRFIKANSMFTKVEFIQISQNRKRINCVNTAEFNKLFEELKYLFTAVYFVKSSLFIIGRVYRGPLVHCFFSKNVCVLKLLAEFYEFDTATCNFRSLQTFTAGR